MINKKKTKANLKKGFGIGLLQYELYIKLPGFPMNQIYNNVLAPKLENAMNNHRKMTDSKFKCNNLFIFNCNSTYGLS